MKKKLIVLGAGPAGLALAMKLLRRSDLEAEVTVIEQNSYVGGISASFQYKGIYFDYGSHRLHTAVTPEIFEDISGLLGEELLDRPRNGRIRLLNHFVKFPLNPFNLTRHLPFSFISRFGWDIVNKPFRKKHNPQESFADVLLDGLGPTMCNTFYFPYAHKLWGLKPQEISAIQAQRRVSANSLSKIVSKLISILPGFKKEGAGRYYYPRKGFGQISQVMAQEVERLGGKIRLSTEIQQIRLQNNSPASIVVRQNMDSESGENKTTELNQEELAADFIFSTIPITTLASLLSPEPPARIQDACQNLESRAMVFHYMLLPIEQFTPYDAHYFPEENVIFSRVSETKNYYNTQEPAGLTGLCAEIPCNIGDSIWNATEEEITPKVMAGLKLVGLPLHPPVQESFLRRLPGVYPSYDLNFDSRLKILDDHIGSIADLVSLGRQGLFAHDNLHHTMETAYRASDCLAPNLNWNSDNWQICRKKFTEHVVVD